MELLGRLDHGEELSRFKFSAFLSILFHVLIFFVGGLLMADRAEYGVAGVLAGSAKPRRIQRPTFEMVEFIPDPSDAPAERRDRSRVRPKLAVPIETAGNPSGGAFEIPAYYRNPPPPYPSEARQLKKEGMVMLRVEVNAEGKAVSVSVTRSAGFSALDLAALETVRGWKFKPARVAGIPISTSVNIPVNFRLKDAR
jgi:protein TonB